MYTQSLMQMASRVDQLSFFEEADEPEAKERTNSCEDVHQTSQFEPLEIGEDAGEMVKAQAAETNSSKSAENSPNLSAIQDHSRLLSRFDSASSQDMQTTASSSKLLQMIKPSREQADEEIGNLTEAQLKLFLKLCKDPSVAK